MNDTSKQNISAVVYNRLRSPSEHDHIRWRLDPTQLCQSQGTGPSQLVAANIRSIIFEPSRGSATYVIVLGVPGRLRLLRGIIAVDII